VILGLVLLSQMFITNTEEETYTCTSCGVTKPVLDFYMTRRKKHGYRLSIHAKCKVCHLQQVHNRYAANPEKYRLARKRYLYGIEEDEYNRLYQEQKGLCAICRGAAHPRYGKLVVDHDHETGRVRGLLCNNCNVAVGMLKEDPTIFEAGARYVRDFRPSTT